MKFGMWLEVNEWCTMVCSMTLSRVKVTSPRKLEKLPFSKAISSTIYNGSWQLTPVFLKLGHNILIWSGRILIFSLPCSFCVTWLTTWQKRQLWRVDRQSYTGLFICVYLVLDKSVSTKCGRFSTVLSNSLPVCDRCVIFQRWLQTLRQELTTRHNDPAFIKHFVSVIFRLLSIPVQAFVITSVH